MVSNVQDKPVTEARTRQPVGVLLLPGHLFFVRTLPLPAGVSSEELPSFVELSLEQISPFSLNQLYYGYYLPEGASHLLLFAAYRKQLAVYEDEEWVAAELVLPEFSSLLGLSPKRPTIAFLENEFEITAIFWNGKNEQPEKIISRRREAEENSETDRELREVLKKRIGPVPKESELLVFRDPKPKFEDKNLVFGLESEGGERRVRLQRPFFWPMDVRDKDFLVKVRREQRQNRYIWGGMMLIFAAFLALGIFELVLFGGNKLIERRETRLDELQPTVEQIMRQEELAVKLEELGGERLLPFEMLAHLNKNRPRSIYFTRVATDGLRSFQIEALTPRSQDVDRYQRLLEQDEDLEGIEVRNLQLRSRDQLNSFVLAGTFAKGKLTDFSLEEPADPLSIPGAEAAEDLETEEFPDQLEEESAGGNGRPIREENESELPEFPKSEESNREDEEAGR